MKLKMAHGEDYYVRASAVFLFASLFSRWKRKTLGWNEEMESRDADWGGMRWVANYVDSNNVNIQYTHIGHRNVRASFCVVCTHFPRLFCSPTRSLAHSLDQLQFAMKRTVRGHWKMEQVSNVQFPYQTAFHFVALTHRMLFSRIVTFDWQPFDSIQFLLSLYLFFHYFVSFFFSFRIIQYIAIVLYGTRIITWTFFFLRVCVKNRRKRWTLALKQRWTHSCKMWDTVNGCSHALK